MRIDLRQPGEHIVTLSFPTPKKRESDYGGYYYIYGCRCQDEQSSFIAEEAFHAKLQGMGVGKGTMLKVWGEAKMNEETGKNKVFFFAEKIGNASSQQGQYGGNGGGGGGENGGGGDRTMAIELQCMTKCSAWLVAGMLDGKGGNPEEIAQTTTDLAERLYDKYKDQMKKLALVNDAERPHQERSKEPGPDPEPAQNRPSDSSEEDPDMFGQNQDIFGDLGAVPF